MIFDHKPIVLECQSCDQIRVGPEPGPAVCKIYPDPAWIWGRGYCVFGTRKPFTDREPTQITEQDLGEIPQYEDGNEDG